jgi:SHS2 domain-containing protein
MYVIKDTITIRSIQDLNRFGEEWNTEKHPQGTEIKAITYSNMQIHSHPQQQRHDVYVIVDI